MVVKVLPPLNAGSGKVKIHKRSRHGCSNCKLRNVKCDEEKPGCKRCKAYGVVCSYNRKSPDLQLPVETAINIERERCLPYWPSMNEKMLEKFRNRTALTCSAGKRLYEYQNEAVKLACSVCMSKPDQATTLTMVDQSPSVMHAILTLTLMHDRHLSSQSKAGLSKSEAYHFVQATSSFHNQLSRPLEEWQQTANRVTSSLLGTVVFCHLEAVTPEEAWPLRPSSPADLDWLRMSDGKRVVWGTPKLHLESEVTSTPQSGSTGSDYTTDLFFENLPQAESHNLPQAFITLYRLDSVPADNNPYRSAALTFMQSSVTSLHHISIILNFWSFVSNMNPAFRLLLEQKDPRALLLLAFWYSRLCGLGVWWFMQRTLLEGRSVCLYLERYWSHDIVIQSLLQLPKQLLYLRGQP